MLQNPTQRQFQHVKASKSMDLGTTQTRQHTGGNNLYYSSTAWRLHASHKKTPPDAWLHLQRLASQTPPKYFLLKYFTIQDSEIRKQFTQFKTQSLGEIHEVQYMKLDCKLISFGKIPEPKSELLKKQIVLLFLSG